MKDKISDLPSQSRHVRSSWRSGLRVVLQGIGTSVPPSSFTQKEVLSFVKNTLSLSARALSFYEKILGHPSIQKRHFALNRLEEVLDNNPDHRSRRFEDWAVRLTTEAIKKSFSIAGIGSRDVDFVVVATCTGYLCPGLSSHMFDRLNLRRDTKHADLVGMGCGAALPALEMAFNFVQAHPGTTAIAAATEICSTDFYFDEAPDIILSNSLFGDGAAAVVLHSTQANPGSGDQPLLRSLSSITIPEWRESLRFKTERGLLRNVLGREVPNQTAEAFEHAIRRLLTDAGLTRNDVNRWIFHAGGAKVLDKIQKTLNLAPDALTSSRDILSEYGNMSSPSVLFATQRELERRPGRSGERVVLGSFGAGFTAFAGLLEFA